MAELATRWAVTSNTVSRRLAFLGIKPIRQGNFRFLTPEQLDLAEALHHHIQAGKPLESFPRPEGEASAIVRRKPPASPAPDASALMAALAALSPASSPPDPLQRARRLAEAADLGVWLSNAELAALLGMAESTLRDKSDDYSPRPGFLLKRHKGQNGSIWWKVAREAQAAGQ